MAHGGLWFVIQGNEQLIPTLERESYQKNVLTQSFKPQSASQANIN